MGAPPSPESSQPFTKDQLDAILVSAKEVGEEDAVRILKEFGLHPVCLTDLTPDNIIQTMEDGREKFYLQWRRAKTGSQVNYPIQPGVLPWLRSYLSTDRPGTRWAYNKKLDKVRLRLRTHGYDFGPLNPRRFRHTLAVRLLELGHSETEVGQLMRVSPMTLRIYATLSRSRLYDKLVQKGWPS